jgi:hypothetical protein
MASDMNTDKIQSLINELSTSLDTFTQLNSIPVKLDALTSELLTNSFVLQSLGQSQAMALAQKGVGFPQLLRILRGDNFEQAAQLAEKLLELNESSMNRSSEDLQYAETLRSRLKDVLENVLNQIQKTPPAR